MLAIEEGDRHEQRSFIPPHPPSIRPGGGHLMKRYSASMVYSVKQIHDTQKLPVRLSAFTLRATFSELVQKILPQERYPQNPSY
jgi:hypothetical protein